MAPKVADRKGAFSLSLKITANRNWRWWRQHNATTSTSTPTRTTDIGDDSDYRRTSKFHASERFCAFCASRSTRTIYRHVPALRLPPADISTLSLRRGVVRLKLKLSTLPQTKYVSCVLSTRRCLPPGPPTTSQKTKSISQAGINRMASFTHTTPNVISIFMK